MKKSVRLLCTAVLVSFAAFSGGAFAQVNPKLPEPGWAPAGSPVAVHGALKVGKVGSKGAVLDKGGNPVTLRGMSLFWANAMNDGAAYYNDATVGWLAHDWYSSVVRAAIGVWDEPKGVSNPGYADGAAGSMLGAARAVIEMSIHTGIYVIVDWHMHTQPPNSQAKATEFFNIISKDYGKYPNVIYELWNEPIGDQWSTIKSFSEAVIRDGIRPNSDNLVVVGSPQYSSQPQNAINNTVTDSKSNTAYSIHMYACTHGYSENGGYGGNMNQAINAGLAVFATEWGSVSASGDNNPCPSEADKWVSAMETQKVSWAYWSVNHKNEGASILSKAASTGGPWSLTQSGNYVRPKIYDYNKSKYSSWAKTYKFEANAGTGGRVEKKVGNAASSNAAAHTYGDNVTVNAIPNDGYEFANWEGDASSKLATLTYKVIGANVSVNAVFVPTSLVKNGHFSADANNWTANGAVITRDPAEGGTLKAAVPTNGGSTFRVQTSGYGIKIEAGKRYKLSFRAKTASGTKSVTPRITNGNRNLNYMDTAAVTITSAWKTEEKTFTASASDESAVLLFACGGYSDAWDWYLDDVALDVTDGTPTPVLFNPAVPAARAAWSISKIGGAARLNGPAEAGVTVTLYDTRGKAVKSMAAKDGLTLNAAGVPAGGYLAVVKNASGAQVLRSKIVLTR